MDRDRPIARLSPIRPPGEEGAQGTVAEEKALLEELVRQGLVRPARGKIPPDVLRKPLPGKPGVLAALFREREEDRR